MTNQILVGSLTSPSAVFTPDSIRDISGNFTSAIIGDTLSVDTLVPTVGLAIIFDVTFITADDESFYTADDDPFYTADTEEAPADETLEEGTVLYWKHGTNLKGKFYVRDVIRTGVKTYQVKACSAIGLLDTVRHKGGIYTGQTVAELLPEIIGNNFSFSVSDDVSEQRVYGWLPFDTARNNLHKLLMAIGINVTKDTDGEVSFEFMSIGTPKNVPDDRVFIGGSVRRETVASRVEVTEHSFIPSGEAVTVFDNTDASGAAEHKLVVFKDAPVYDLTPSSALIVEESNPNYAVVSGTGVLMAKRYTDVTQVVTASNNAARTENVKRVTSDTLINPINGENVLRRLYDYFTRSDTIGADIKVTTELPNQLLMLTDAFRNQQTVWLKSMDFRATTFIRASSQLVADYMPGHFGNLYTAVHRLTANGSWTVPSGVDRIRVVLIGGGSGGNGGYDGKDGRGWSATYEGEMFYDETDTMQIWYYKGGQEFGGDGGAPGTAGENGRMLLLDLAVTPGDVLTFIIGTGGTGGDSNGGIGTAGTDTTAAIGGVTYSTASGIRSRTGVPDLMDATVYGAPGAPGHAGGTGGRSTVNDAYGWHGEDGQDGAPVNEWSGGAGGTGVFYEFIDTDQGGGGGGGGAAYGAVGGAGYAAERIPYMDPDGIHVLGAYVYGGTGGKGADAVAPSTPSYGSGGGGGNGGGGGGNAGGSRIDRPRNRTEYDRVFAGTPGAHGLGSRGGDGGAGIALIYYKAVT